jgi:hypothetical protein
MAETKITDVIVPEVFTDYVQEPSINKSRLVKSGVMVPDTRISAKLTGGGETFNVPFWKDITQGADIPSETVATTVNNITSGKQIILRQEREKAWGANSISDILAGENPLQGVGDKVASFWANDGDNVLINSLVGIKLDNIANDSSDLSNVTATQFNDDGVIDTQGLLGENGIVGSDNNNGNFVAIAVTPGIYNLMRKQNAIDFLTIGDQVRPTEFYLGMEVIVDDQLPVSAGVHTSIIFKSGSIAMGTTTRGYMPTEIDRDATKGMGIDILYNRRVFSVHPKGFAWQDSSVAGLSPTNAELATAANWDRVYNAENIGFVFYDAKLS